MGGKIISGIRVPAFFIAALCCLAASGGAGADQNPPVPGSSLFFNVSHQGRLSISYLPAFDYDGEGSGGYGTVESVEGNIARVRFSGDEVNIPPLQLIRGSNFLRVEILVKELVGEIDLATGRVELDFDARFTPFMGKIERTSISVVTSLTTESSKGMKKKLHGKRMDPSGDALLVGVAVVPKTEDRVINFMLALPADAACELPVNFHFSTRERDLSGLEEAE